MLSVRELNAADIPLLLDYWFGAEPSFLEGMGVDIAKMPSRPEFQRMLARQLDTPIEQRQSYCLVWMLDGLPVGHCNTNPSRYGAEAKMHLHIWQPGKRQKGMGTELVRLSLPFFFQRLRLRELWCEPYALNHAPNRTLEKVGFQLVKEYVTVPGFLNFEQPVKQWRLTAEQFMHIQR